MRLVVIWLASVLMSWGMAGQRYSDYGIVSGSMLDASVYNMSPFCRVWRMINLFGVQFRRDIYFFFIVYIVFKHFSFYNWHTYFKQFIINTSNSYIMYIIAVIIFTMNIYKKQYQTDIKTYTVKIKTWQEMSQYNFKDIQKVFHSTIQCDKIL